MKVSRGFIWKNGRLHWESTFNPRTIDEAVEELADALTHDPMRAER